MNKYRDWEILDELPQGWVIDKTAGSPAPNTVFITNGKSVLNGQKRALLKLEPKRDISIPKNEMVKNNFAEIDKITKKRKRRFSLQKL